MQEEIITADPILKNKLELIEKKLAIIKILRKFNNSQINVIENFHDTDSLEENQLSILKVPVPLNFYIKSEEGFKDHIFVRFASVEYRQTATILFDTSFFTTKIGKWKIYKHLSIIKPCRIVQREISSV